MERGRENGISHELLSSAVSAVCNVYEGHFVSPEPHATQSNPYDVLAQTAQEHPAFSTEIYSFIEGLQVAETIKSSYNTSFDGFGQAFGWRINPSVRGLLVNIMLARTAVSASRLRQGSIFAEADIMASEMGVDGEIASGAFSEASTDQVIGSILAGHLRVTPKEAAS